MNKTVLNIHVIRHQRDHWNNPNVIINLWNYLLYKTYWNKIRNYMKNICIYIFHVIIYVYIYIYIYI